MPTNKAPRRARKQRIPPTPAEIAPLRLVLPLPPSANNSYPTVRYRNKAGKMVSGRVPSKELVAFKDLATKALLAQGIPKGTWANVAAVGYTAYIFVPTRASDKDNRVKHWLDTLANWLGFNDNCAEESHVYRRLDPDRPRVEVEIYPVRQAQPGER